MVRICKIPRNLSRLLEPSLTNPKVASLLYLNMSLCISKADPHSVYFNRVKNKMECENFGPYFWPQINDLFFEPSACVCYISQMFFVSSLFCRFFQSLNNATNCFFFFFPHKNDPKRKQVGSVVSDMRLINMTQQCFIIGISFQHNYMYKNNNKNSLLTLQVKQ